MSNTWIYFWICFALLNGFDSYYADDVLSEYFNALLCALSFMMARIEYLHLKTRINSYE